MREARVDRGNATEEAGGWVGGVGLGWTRSTYAARARGSSRSPGDRGLKPAAGTAISPALGSRSSPGGASPARGGLPPASIRISAAAIHLAPGPPASVLSYISLTHSRTHALTHSRTHA